MNVGVKDLRGRRRLLSESSTEVECLQLELRRGITERDMLKKRSATLLRDPQ